MFAIHPLPHPSPVKGEGSSLRCQHYHPHECLKNPINRHQLSIANTASLYRTLEAEEGFSLADRGRQDTKQRARQRVRRHRLSEDPGAG